MAKKNRPKKSKALVVWAIVTVIVLLADCVATIWSSVCRAT